MHDSQTLSLLSRRGWRARLEVANELARELQSSKQAVDSLQVHLQVSLLEKKVGSLCTRNVHKREKRAAAKLTKQKEKMDALSTKNAALKLVLQQEVKRNRERVVMMRQKSKRKRKQLREKYQKCWRRLDLKCRSMAKKCDNSADSGEPESDDDREVMEVQIDELKEALDNLASEMVCTNDAGTYDHKIRECCMKLLSNNVSI